MAQIIINRKLIILNNCLKKSFGMLKLTQRKLSKKLGKKEIEVRFCYSMKIMSTVTDNYEAMSCHNTI